MAEVVSLVGVGALVLVAVAACNGSTPTPSAAKHPALQEFSTISALFDAIASAQLKEGESYRVVWEKDPRSAAGLLTGKVIAGQPQPSVFEQGVLPLKLFAAQDWTRSGDAGTLSFDGTGYPVLELGTNAVATGVVRAKLNPRRYSFRRFTEARLRIDEDLTTAAPLSGVGFELWDADDKNALIVNHFVEAGRATSLAFDYYEQGRLKLTGGSATRSSLAFDGYWVLVPHSSGAKLSMTAELQSLDKVPLGADSSDVTGQGDWSQDKGLSYQAAFRIYRSLGGAGIARAVGVTLEIVR